MKYFLNTASICVVFFSSLILAVPRAAVITEPTAFESINASATTTASGIVQLIRKTGRFTVERVSAGPEDRSVNDLMVRARQDGADIAVIISIYQQGPVSYGELKINAFDPELARFNRGVRVRSNLMQNIPVLLQREFVGFTADMPVLITPLERDGERTVIDAGTYSGLERGKTYSLTGGGAVTVHTAGRHSSVVTGQVPDDRSMIALYPDATSVEKQIDTALEENILRRYGAGYAYLKGDQPDRHYLESLLVINPLGNLFLPGYGAFLSTHYMGFENPVPSYGSMGACAALYLYELLYIPAKNGFRVNFFPWVQDPDKSDGDFRTQQFLWAMIPLTFSASYLDQLSLQYHHSSVLPPGAMDPYATALHSLVVPGGGFFYKGHRWIGWSYFAAQFGAGMYAVSHWGSDSGRYALYGLASLKAADIIHSVMIRPAYGFYSREKYDTTELRVSFNVVPEPSGSSVFYAGVGRSF
ncbi:MAG: hypothetical protein ACOC2H_03500 [Spirochaetota bacterium]